MASGFTAFCNRRASRATWSIRPRLRRRAGAGGPRRTGLTARRCCGRCWPKSAASRGFARWSLPPHRTKRTARIEHVNRIKGLLFAQGISDYAPMRCNRRGPLEGLRTGGGRLLPAHLKAQLRRELDRLELLLGQIEAVEAEQDALLAAAGQPATGSAPDPVTMLLALKGMGPNFAAVLWSEAFYRQFANRRQLAAYAGLAPTPWRSGSIEHEQGVSKAGNPRLRTTMIQLAWLWLRHQDQSALARWFKAQSQRGRKSAIVALARKLLVALWKYVTSGVVIEGAKMKSA